MVPLVEFASAVDAGRVRGRYRKRRRRARGDRACGPARRSSASASLRSHQAPEAPRLRHAIPQLWRRTAGRQRARRRAGRALHQAPSARPVGLGPPRRSRLDVPRAATRQPGAAGQSARVLRLGHAGGRRDAHVRERAWPVASLQRVHHADQPGPRHLAHLGLLGLRARDARSPPSACPTSAGWSTASACAGWCSWSRRCSAPRRSPSARSPGP